MKSQLQLENLVESTIRATEGFTLVSMTLYPPFKVVPKSLLYVDAFIIFTVFFILRFYISCNCGMNGGTVSYIMM
jgi:hypothetical protein